MWHWSWAVGGAWKNAENIILGGWKMQRNWVPVVTWKTENIPPEHLGLREDISRQNVENVSWLLLRKELARFEENTDEMES